MSYSNGSGVERGPQFPPIFSADNSITLSDIDPFPALSRDGSRLVVTERMASHSTMAAGLTFLDLGGLGRRPLFHKAQQAADAAG